MPLKAVFHQCLNCLLIKIYSKTCLKRPLKKKTKIGFHDRLSLNAGQKYRRMLHSAILSTFIKLPILLKIFVLSIFEWPLKTGFTVNSLQGQKYIVYWKFDRQPLKIQNGPFHTNCVNMYGIVYRNEKGLGKMYIWAVTWDLQQCGMCDQQSLRSACAYAQSDQSLC